MSGSPPQILVVDDDDEIRSLLQIVLTREGFRVQQAKDARNALDTAVEQARERQDQALVIARCEYHPTPSCPQTRITGVPGTGPETQTADELLADAQRELDSALATRDSQAPELDAKVTHAGEDSMEGRPGMAATTSISTTRAYARPDLPPLRRTNRSSRK